MRNLAGSQQWPAGDSVGIPLPPTTSVMEGPGFQVAGNIVRSVVAVELQAGRPASCSLRYDARRVPNEERNGSFRKA